MHNCFANFYESVWHFAQSFKLSGSKKKKRYRRLWSQSNQNIWMRGLQSKEQESKLNIWFIHKQCIILPKQLFLVQFLKSKRESLRRRIQCLYLRGMANLKKRVKNFGNCENFWNYATLTSCRSGNPVEFPHRRGCFSRKLLLWWQIDTRFVNGWARLVACFQSRQLTLPKGGSWGGRELLCSAECSKIGKLTLLYFFGPITEGHSFVGSPSHKATTNLDLGTRQNQ